MKQNKVKKRIETETRMDRFTEHIYTHGWAYVVILVIIFGLFSGFFYTRVIPLTDNQYCKHNPDKCVCEEYRQIEFDCNFVKEGIYIGDNMKCYTNSAKCKSYRKLTEEELKIKYCNENPNDEEKCVCDEYPKKRCFVNATYTIIGDYINLTLIQKAEDNDRKCIEYWGYTLMSTHNYIIKEQNWRNITLSNNCIKSHPILKPSDIDLEKEKCVEHSDIEPNCKIFKDDFFNDKESYDTWCCTKKEPKTECEKGSPDYIYDGNLCSIKTFEDLTCDELERAWQKSYWCHKPKKDDWGCGRYELKTREEINHQQLIKGCFKS